MPGEGFDALVGVTWFAGLSATVSIGARLDAPVGLIVLLAILLPLIPVALLYFLREKKLLTAKTAAGGIAVLLTGGITLFLWYTVISTVVYVALGEMTAWALVGEFVFIPMAIGATYVTVRHILDSIEEDRNDK